MDYRWAWGNFGDDGGVHYLDWADNFPGVCGIYTYYQTLLNSVLLSSAAYCSSVMPQSCNTKTLY